MNVINRLFSRSAGGARTAEPFKQQLQDRQVADDAKGVKRTDVTNLPFSIMMEVKGNATKIGRTLNAANLPWTTACTAGD